MFAVPVDAGMLGFAAPDVEVGLAAGGGAVGLPFVGLL